MTTVTISQQRQTTNPAILFLFLVLLVAVAASAHAIAKHAAEATAVTNGCNQYGPDMVVKTSGRKHANSFWEVCQTAGGEYGVRKIQCTKDGWRNITAFVPKASQLARGSFARAVEYASAKGSPYLEPLTEVCQ